ncbi:MAG TPA: CoA transferase [Azospirillum sp.]|nr:CoA transferase [Azospirillum sp.]
MADDGPGPLGHLRVLELGPRMAYAGRLYALMGAVVIVVNRAPPAPDDTAFRALLARYLDQGKTRVDLDLATDEGRRRLRNLVDAADLILDDRPPDAWRDCGVVAEDRVLDGAVWCTLTPFGLTGPRASDRGDDAVCMAAGGMAWLTGYEDTGPLVAAGDLAERGGALYAAVCGLLALLHGRGQLIDVSMQEVVALGTETAPQFTDMKGIVRRRQGEYERQAGIGLYPCADGLVMVYATETGVGAGWRRLVEWLVEEGAPGAEAMREEAWLSNAFKARPEAREAFADAFRHIAAHRTRQDLFEEAQRRRIAVAPINTGADVLRDSHLEAVGALRPLGTARAPGPPFRLRFGPPGARKRLGGGLPLEGVTVVDFSWVGAGPFTTKLLADFGARVVRVESSVRPDQLRRAEPVAGKADLEDSGYFANRNTNKWSVSLDLKHPLGRRTALAMARRADVVVNSFSPGVLERLGVGYEAVAAENPSVIYVDMPMAGTEGPYRHVMGYGMSIAALIGHYALCGLPGRRPVGTGTNYPDHIPNPLHAAFAILTALDARRRSGRGCAVALSQLESTLSMLPDAVLAEFAADRPQPVRAYRCAGEDSWLVASCADDLTAWAAERTAREAERQLQAAGIPAAAVLDPAALLADEQLRARGFWRRLEHPVMGSTLYHGVAARFSTIPTDYRTPAPLLGQYNGHLAELAGLDEAELAELLASGAVR